MSRLPGLTLGSQNKSKVKRISRQPSMDLRRRKTLEIKEKEPTFYIGERVAVESMGIVGTLKFLGEAEFKEGYWAGIQLDIPGTGKNDGSVKGLRYFSCPPQTGLFVLASKLTPLDHQQDSDTSVHSISPLPGNYKSNQAPLHTPVASPVSSNRQSMRSLPQLQSPTSTHDRGTPPSPAMTPINHIPDDDEDEPSEVDVIQLKALQHRVETLEAENNQLKLENSQTKAKTAFELEEHKKVVQALEMSHQARSQDWEQSQEKTKAEIERLETKVRQLESEQASLLTERDTLATEVEEAKRSKVEVEQRLSVLEEKVAEAQAAAAAAQENEKRLIEKAQALQQQQQFFQPGEDDRASRQFQLEVAMEEAHEKMNSLREAARAKDIFLTTLSEQVEVHRNAVEEKEREIQRIQAEADRQGRERDRVQKELETLEAKASNHNDCVDKAAFEQLQAEYLALKQSESSKDSIRELQETIEELKRAGMESIELYESSVEMHRAELDSLNATLADECRKVALLEAERDELRTAGRETIDACDATMAEMKAEHERLAQEQELKCQGLQATIDDLKKEIELLMTTQRSLKDADDVWESERKRLTEQVAAGTEALEKEMAINARLRKEIEGLGEQLKKNEGLEKEKARYEEELGELRARYDEQQQLAHGQSLDDARLAVEKQKEMENELARMTEQKEKLERDLQNMTSSENIEKYKCEIDQLRAENAALAKQKDSKESQQMIDSLRTENKHLMDKQKLLEEAHKQTELECLKLMEEVEKLHQTEQQQPTVIQLEGLTEDEKIKELSYLLQDNQKKMDQLIISHTTELRKCKEREEEEEKEYKRHVAKLNQDISELEGLIESKIFREADLEEALENEHKMVERLQRELEDLKEEFATNRREEKKWVKQVAKEEESGPYCEICEIYGHDLISCKAVTISDL
ncbi:hypothetical protein G6F46_004081 [Rhizopus delemar]|uniref:CAP-Gly domain-containing protein n=3 Tax=Rhizopus TaxID=4842 RepID=I1BTU6_RHIO9|nr:hypothetical protein RO3G_04331 [Rhizopus delemar RA 99-880]KAG1462631.1 hypothetical protein G6F55_002853 [Rhizopus delemar]KAG1547280.1 hypothetical protein G6F51_004362 [Rhizopus arrhizus]KAG1500765.1 hypothetical protein G6F54_003500 [Rhizopus delemar]KAG1515327.1 hypothetical protein G6F53_003002 [Rhizopus delemar]|eukprot:EIE79626.1 hypothetical protein RO3G_04331 [Rhizopus delemar RA 99-880]